ncbi:MAG: hypothetical protein KJZ70_07050 [Bryobacterales bacterium]|nr:hypothetical protein [Bryobacterales bacterium]
MKISLGVLTILLLSAVPLYAAGGGELGAQSAAATSPQEAARGLRESQGTVPRDAATARSLAALLDRYAAPGRFAAYERYWDLLGPDGADEEKRNALRRMVVLSLEERKPEQTEKYLALYRQAGGTDLALPDPASGNTASSLYGTIEIPGPLPAFARMAALAPDVSPELLLSALARNISISGYRSMGPEGGMQETEYLRLVFRYLQQAQDLAKLAGERKVLRIGECESTETGELLKILGYRMRGGCGGDLVLETVNPTKAFITVDSGFPLADLEQALRTNRPFAYDMTPTKIPILYGPDYWALNDPKKEKSPIQVLLSDPALCRLYLSLAKLETNTAEIIRKDIELEKLRAFSHVIDFYGAMFHVENGRVVTPGGAKAQAKWEKMVGASVSKPSEFFMKLISSDDGWLACYYDALYRIEGPAKEYLTEPERMERFYEALRGKITSPGPARPVFRANTDMLIFTHRLRLDADGRPHIPGTLAVWKELFADKKFVDDRRLRRAAPGWRDADDLIAALFGLSRSYVENLPLRMFIATSEMNRLRDRPLEPATVQLLLNEYNTLRSQYSLLTESPHLSDEAIRQFVETALATQKIRNEELRADTVGSLQGLLGLWQIYTRHGILRGPDVDSTFRKILESVGKPENEAQLFANARKGVQDLLAATGGAGGADPQKHIVNLLAGVRNAGDPAVLAKQTQTINTIVDAQNLLTLTDLFTLDDQLQGAASGGAIDTSLVNRLTAQIGRIQSARASLSTDEKNALSFGRIAEQHVEHERKVRLRAEVDKNSNSPEKMLALREELAPHLRDTLVGLVYAHYAPPGGQILLTNSQFVRYHDFSGLPGTDYSWAPTEVAGVGWSATSGGRLMGSLSELPYALAQAEQNFLVPDREQALIWGDLVPQVLLTATVPRWWNVSPTQVHYVALLQRAGKSLLAEAVVDATVRGQVMASLDHCSNPHRVSEVRRAIQRRDPKAATELLMPSELFRVGLDVLAANRTLQSPIYTEIRHLQQSDPSVKMETISDLFGSPKPALTHSYRPELLGLRTMPTMMGYSSRLMAETWESGALYWAEISDRLEMKPEELNITIPEWTRETIEGIFATHLEDWPALLRSMRRVGESKVNGSSESTPMGGGQ